MFTQEEKDKMKQEAGFAYIRTYGEPTSHNERFHVQKGIEAMAAIVFAATEEAA